MNFNEADHDTVSLLVGAALIALAWMIAVAVPLICLALQPTGCASDSIEGFFVFTAIMAAAATWYIAQVLL